MNYLFALATICLVFCIFLLFYLFYYLYIAKSRHEIQSQWYKFPTLLASLFYCGVCITYLLISLTMNVNLEFNTQNVSGYFLSIICLLILFLILSKLSIYVSILSRLYLTFCESAYFVRKSILNLMICVLFLFFLCGIYWNVLLYTKYRLKNPPSSYYIQFEVVFISLIIYVLYCVLIAGLHFICICILFIFIVFVIFVRVYIFFCYVYLAKFHLIQ